MIRKITTALLLAAMICAAPTARAQSITCTPQPNGQTICEQTPHPPSKRLAITAAVIVGVAVVVYILHRHRKHKHADAPAPAQPA